MNRQEVIKLAKQSGLFVELVLERDLDWLERFAALVASAERESLRESFRVVTAAEASAAILHEREACAKLCDDLDDDIVDGLAGWQYGDAIRARRQA